MLNTKSSITRLLFLVTFIVTSSCFSMEGDKSSESKDDELLEARLQDLSNERVQRDALRNLQVALGYNEDVRNPVFFRPDIQRGQAIVNELLGSRPTEALLNTILFYLAQVVPHYKSDIGSIHKREAFITFLLSDALALATTSHEASTFIPIVLFFLFMFPWIKEALLSPNNLTVENLQVLLNMMADIVAHMRVCKMTVDQSVLSILALNGFSIPNVANSSASSIAEDSDSDNADENEEEES